MKATTSAGPGPELGSITTEWSLVFDPVHFVDRYEKAIKKYLCALLKNPSDAEDVAQDFFLWVTANGFPRARRERGRFRDYLKVAVKNWALNFLRRKRAELNHPGLFDLSGKEQASEETDREWLAEWRRCLLKRAWRDLEKHQNRSGSDIYYTVLRLAASRPTDDSRALANHASTILGRPIRADAFRKQLSRARRLFAELVVKEVAQTLDFPVPVLVEEELVALGLMRYVGHFLSADWHAQLDEMLQAK